MKQRWICWAAAAAACGCGDSADEAAAYGETDRAVVVQVWVADSAYDAEFMKGQDTTLQVRLGRSQSWPVGQAQRSTSPNDTRPDYFRLFPGSRATASTPPSAEAVYYDLYAAIVLDTAVTPEEITSADAVRHLSGQRFALPDAWTFDSIPGGEALRDQLNLSGMEELIFFQNPDGSYPRVLLMPLNVVAPLRTHRRS